MTRDQKERGEREADFLSRWSRRKQDARHAPAAPEGQPAPPDDAPEKSEAEILEELGLPDPETLGPGSDFRAFMAAAVPDAIRRKALRKLWTSNPVLANLDMLVDYGEDYSNKARVVANLQSAYRAGRGYLDRRSEAAPAETDAPQETPESAPQQTVAEAGDGAPERAAEERQESAPQEPAPSAEEPAAAARIAGEETAPDTGEAPPAAEAPAERTTLAEMPPPRRRMRFDFD